MSEADRIAISNKAALGAGVGTIDTLVSASTAEEIFCREWYETVVESELSLYRWKFASKTYNLTPNLLVATPDTGFTTAYQLPNDVVSVDTVLVNGVPIEFDRYQDEIHTNSTSSDTVILKYRYRPPEPEWYPYFTQLIIYRLATMLAFSIARRETIAASMKVLADEHWRRCKTEDAQSRTNQKVDIRKIVRGRGGSLDKFWRNR